MDCKICAKIKEKEPEFSSKDINIITKATKYTLKFLVDNKIITTPVNFERWFNVFAYLSEHNLSPEECPKEKLLKLFEELNEDVDKNSFEKYKEEVNVVFDKIKLGMEDTISNLANYESILEKRSEEIKKEQEKIEDKSLKEITLKILEETTKLRDENKVFRERLERQTEEIRKLQEELSITKEEANVDYLTKLPNRRSFTRTMEDLFKSYKTYGVPFSFVMLDVDNFKQINDTYGHDFGDKVLVEIGKILRTFLRAKDIPGRLGGEEFGILLPDVKLEQAYKVAERLRQAIEVRDLEVEDGKYVNFTTSIGVAEVNDSMESVEELYKKADEALYKAKRNGKNQVQLSESIGSIT
jgi:diguanylate cyclase